MFISFFYYSVLLIIVCFIQLAYIRNFEMKGFYDCYLINVKYFNNN